MGPVVKWPNTSVRKTDTRAFESRLVLMTQDEITTQLIAGLLDGRLILNSEPEYQPFKWQVCAAMTPGATPGWHLLENDEAAAESLRTGVVSTLGEHWSQVAGNSYLTFSYPCRCSFCTNDQG